MAELRNISVKVHWPKRNKSIPFLSGLTGADEFADRTMISTRGAIFVSVSTPRAAMEKGKEYSESLSQGGD